MIESSTHTPLGKRACDGHGERPVSPTRARAGVPARRASLRSGRMAPACREAEGARGWFRVRGRRPLNSRGQQHKIFITNHTRFTKSIYTYIHVSRFGRLRAASLESSDVPSSEPARPASWRALPPTAGRAAAGLCSNAGFCHSSRPALARHPAHQTAWLPLLWMKTQWQARSGRRRRPGTLPRPAGCSMHARRWNGNAT